MAVIPKGPPQVGLPAQLPRPAGPAKPTKPTKPTEFGTVPAAPGGLAKPPPRPHLKGPVDGLDAPVVARGDVFQRLTGDRSRPAVPESSAKPVGVPGWLLGVSGGRGGVLKTSLEQAQEGFKQYLAEHPAATEAEVAAEVERLKSEIGNAENWGAKFDAWRVKASTPSTAE
jgi:hypothetical protein